MELFKEHTFEAVHRLCIYRGENSIGANGA